MVSPLSPTRPILHKNSLFYLVTKLVCVLKDNNNDMSDKFNLSEEFEKLGNRALKVYQDTEL